MVGRQLAIQISERYTVWLYLEAMVYLFAQF